MDLRLRIQESRKVVADLQLRTKLLNVQLLTCGCGLRKLKFGCGFADCRLKKKLAVPSTGIVCVIYRRPSLTEINKFLSDLFACLFELSNCNKSFYLLGNVNINIDQNNLINLAIDYINILLCHGQRLT